MELGVCLSGGGIKGAAHIGVLQALEEKNIKFNYISGTSSGSIVAGLYACGYKPKEIYELFKIYCNEIEYIDFKNIFKIIKSLIFKKKLLIDGLNSGYKLEKIIARACNEKNIANINEIDLNLYIPAVNLEDGEIYYFYSKKNNTNRNRFSDNIKYINDAKIEKVIRASCSFPGIFSPCEFGDVKLLDGGIRENTPWKELKKNGADKILAVNFETKKKKEYSEKNLVEILLHSLDIMEHELANYELDGIDYLITVKTDKISLLDASKLEYLYNMGYNEGKKFLEKEKII